MLKYRHIYIYYYDQHNYKFRISLLVGVCVVLANWLWTAHIVIVICLTVMRYDSLRYRATTYPGDWPKTLVRWRPLGTSQSATALGVPCSRN